MTLAQSSTTPSIAFCTSVMDRLWQFRETLPVNLKLLANTPHFIAICNFNSTDGLDDFIRTCFSEEIRSGKLVYFHTTEPSSFHASIAKNAAHRLALKFNPEFVFNLDCDNFITNEGMKVLENNIKENSNIVVHEWSGVWGDGSFGRIGLSSANWQRLGGYDEALLPMSFQDKDLLIRSRIIALRYRRFYSSELPALQNTMAQKLDKISIEPDDSSKMQIDEETFSYLSRMNLIRFLERPNLLDVSPQRRFNGLLNLTDETTI